MIRKILVLIFGGWMCELGHYHFMFEENKCCWDVNTVRIGGLSSIHHWLLCKKLKRKG